MKRLLFLLTFLLSFSLFASETVKTNIYNLIEPESGDTEYVLFASNGFVYGLPVQDQLLADKAREALGKGLPVELILNDQTEEEIENN